MTTLHLRSRLALALVLASGLAVAQSSAITVRYIGNCGMHMTDGRLDVYVDFPYKSGAYGYMTYPADELDSIPAGATHLFTHRHADHYKKKLVKRLTGVVYGPWKVRKKRRADLSGPTYAAAQFSVETFRTKHRFARHHYSYLITWHGKRIHLSGDTESAATIGQVPALDLAFVPAWILDDAREQRIPIDAARIAVYHLYPNEKFEALDPKVQLLRTRGEVITIPY